jgi:hypothetical protein
MSMPFQPQGGSPQQINRGGKPKKKEGFLGSLLGGGKTYFILALIAAVAAAFGSLAIIGQSGERSVYWVLSTDAPTRTPITANMLQEVETAQGSEPRNALTYNDILNGPQIFANVGLQVGDVVTASVAGPLERIDNNLPDNYVVTSFVVSPENAVAGKVRAGDLIDVIAVDQTDVDGEVAKMVLHRVLVLDVTVNPNTIAKSTTDNSLSNTSASDSANSNPEGNAPGPDSAQIRGGIPLLYTVAVTAKDATKIALIRGKNILIALSSNGSALDEGPVDVQTSQNEVFGIGGVSDSSAGLPVQELTNADGTVMENNGSIDVQTVQPQTAVEPAQPTPSNSAKP